MQPGPAAQQYGGGPAAPPTLGNAELWDALQRHQQVEHGAAASHMAGLPGMQPLQGFPLPSQPGLFGGPSGEGITGLPSSLTCLPAMPYGAASGLQQHPLPQLYGASGYPQLSNMSSQLSSGMALAGTAGSAPQLVPTHPQPLQLSGSGLASAAHLPGAPLMIHSGGPGSLGLPLPVPMPINTHHAGGGLKLEGDDSGHPSSSHSANAIQLPMPDSPGSEGGEDGEASPTDCMGSGGLNKSRYRGVSYDRKKAKWRVQIKVAALGKSGVSVGYFDTEEAAARAYDRAAIGLLGRDNPNLQTNFDARDYTGEAIPPLTGKTREEVKTTLKSERIKQAPRRRFTSRQRTSRFMGVGSSNRKNQWQARILVHGKVTHLGYYETEEEAARVYDKVSLALHGDSAQTNFPASNYTPAEVAVYRGLDRENLQRALGVKPMDKSSKFRGVSKKKGKWEAKVMVNRRWAYRELFDSEEEAARAYDRALWRLKPKEAHSYVNFKDEVPPEVAQLLAAAGEGDPAGGDGGGTPARTGGRAVSQRAAAARHRSSAMGSSDEEEEEEPSSEGLSEEEGSGGTPAWTARGTSRSGRPLRGPAAAVAAAAAASPGRHVKPGSAPPVAPLSGQTGPMGRVSSAPTLLNSSGAATGVGAPGTPTAAAAAAPPLGQLGSGFVALPGGGLQLQFGGSGAGQDGGSGGMLGGPAPPPMPLPVPLPSGGGAGAAGQPLMVRVGSETHLIPHQQQQQHAAAAPGGGPRGGVPKPPLAGASSLGKRMSRIQSEPAFSFKDELGASGELSDLMNDRELFKAFDLTVEGGGDGAPGGGAPAGMDTGMGGGDAGGGSTPGLDLDLDTSELLDFIKEHMPDVPAAPQGGSAPGSGRGAAGMFKSRSMGNLMDLSGPFFDEDDEVLAAMEYARPRKISKSMSVGQLAGMDSGDGASGNAGGGSSGGGRPPLPPGGNGGTAADKLGPLGKPIRRTNTFSSSLAVLQEAEREGRGADDANHSAHGGALVAPHPAGMSSHHSSGDDLVQRLLAPSPGPAPIHPGLDDPMGMSMGLGAADDFLAS